MRFTYTVHSHQDYKLSQACFSTESGRTAFANDTNPACLLGDGNPGGIYIWDVGSAGERSASVRVQTAESDHFKAKRHISRPNEGDSDVPIGRQ